MNTRTLANPVAIAAAVLVAGVLSLLILEARAIKYDYYVSHAERTRAIQSAETDVHASLADMAAAFATGSNVSRVIEANLARLRDANETLQRFADTPRQSQDVAARLAAFDSALERHLASSEVFVARQNALAAWLEVLQDESPVLIRALRERGLPAEAGAVFTLALDTIEFATGQGAADPDALRERVADLRDDPNLLAQPPGLATAFLDAVAAITDEHTAAETALAAVEQSTVLPDLSGLDTALAAFDADTVRRAEIARFLLSASALLLLLGAGFAIYRLQSSYRALNRSNEQLERAKDTLEERVSERTVELEKAYDELKESQVQLIHAEKMSSLGEMIAGLSHEINTPLWYLMSNSSVIQERLEAASHLCGIAESTVAAALTGADGRKSVREGFVEMRRLVQSGIREDIEEAKELIRDSIDGLDELTTLAQGLKDFSRLDRAQHAPFDVNEGLERALLIMRNRLKQRIEVHRFYEDVPMVYCSPSQINQVFLNLLSNAADAIEGRGNIVVRTRTENGKAIISIGDTGCGIPADVLPKIRNPFFTTKELGKGTGLGLSIVDRIMAAHEGELHVASMPGRGTTVTVELPVAGQGVAVMEGGVDLPVLVDVAVMNQGNGRFVERRSQPDRQSP